MVTATPTPEPTATSTPTPVPIPTPTLLLVEEAEETESSMFKLVNEHREELGLSPLARHPYLDELALDYSASRFSDEFLEKTDLGYLLFNSWRRCFSSGPPHFDANTAREGIDFCLEQPDLKEAMLRPEGRTTGLGIAVIGDTIYCTQAFDVLNALGGDKQPIRLYENPGARDVDWETLKSFLLRDDTNEQIYRDGSHGDDAFVCSDFAEMLHNNAEEAGIRAAYVCIDFPSGPGHALNAFHVAEKTVFIDCTGPRSPSSIGISDKGSYIQEGENYGVISLDVAQRFTYDYLEQYTEQVNRCLEEHQSYNEEVEEFNSATERYNERVGKCDEQTLSEEYDWLTTERERLEEWNISLTEWRKRLEEEERALGIDRGYYDPADTLYGVTDPTVTKVYIHW